MSVQRRRLSLLVAFILVVIGLVGVPAQVSPAEAALHNPIPADASGDPNFDFLDNQSLWAYMTSDIKGGRICIVPGVGDFGTLSCDRPAMGVPTRIAASIGLVFALIKNAPLAPGTFRLLVEDSQSNPVEASPPFHVSTCVDCDPNPDAEIVEAFKAGAAVMALRMEGMCTLQGLLEKRANQAISMRGIKKDIEIPAFTVSFSTPTFVIIGGTPSFPIVTIQDPATFNINKALDIMKMVACGAQAMYEDLAFDPPDPDYQQLSAPVPVVIIGTLSPAALDTSVRSIDRQRALAEATLHAFERYQGANAAGDATWQIAQLRAAGDYSLELAIELTRSAKALRQWADVAATDAALADPILATPDAPGLAALYARLRDTGFVADEIAQFHALGYSDADIAAVRTHASVDLDKVPLDTTYPEALRSIATAFEDQAAAFADFSSELYADAGRIEASSAQLTVIKHVINNSGGTGVAADFSLTVIGTTPSLASFAGSETGVLVTMGPGEYSVDEAAVLGYAKSLSAGCTGTIAVGASVICTITNDDIGADASVLTVIKHVVNNNGGTKTAGDFTLTVTAASPSASTFPGSETGVLITLGSGAYSVDELAVVGYTKSSTPNCVGTIAAGEAKTCTITNDDDASPPANREPLAVDDTLAAVTGVAATLNVLANDSDPDGDALTVSAWTQGANGTVSCNVAGTCTYTANASFSGSDSFGYTTADGKGGTASATVSVTVTASPPANREPLAVGDTLAAVTSTPASLNVLANDSDPDGDALTVSASTQGVNGGVSCAAAGSCTYTANAGFSGADSFGYTIVDGKGGTASATVSVTVSATPPTNREPIAVDDTLPVLPRTPASLDVLANDSDPDGDALTVSAWTQGANGNVGCDPAGLCTYVPNAGFSGIDSFDYTIVDGRGGTASATVSVSVFDPASAVTLTQISTQFNNPVGIDFHEPTNSVVVSVNYSTGFPLNFERIASDGSHHPFSTTSGLTDEVKIASVRSGPCQGGFVPGELFTGTGVPGVIARISPDGTGIQDPWVVLPNEFGLMRGSLFQDRYCTFGGDLIAVTTGGGVWRITSAGVPTRVAQISTHLEGLTTVPNDVATYGPWAGKILVGAEQQGLIYAIAADGTTTFFVLGISVEDIDIVPDNENFFGVDFGAGIIWGAPASEFADKVGHVVIAQESSPAVLWDVRWNPAVGSFQVDEIARVAQWEHVTFAPAGIVEVPPVNTPPTVNAGPDRTGVEGSLVSLDGTVTNAETADTLTTLWTYAATSGVDAGTLCTFGNAALVDTTISCTDDGVFTLTLSANDGVNTAVLDTATLTLSNANPVVTITAPAAGALFPTGAAVNLAASFSDAGAHDTHTCSIAWGDGATSVGTILAGVCSASHSYTQPGARTITVTVTDDDSGTGTATVGITIDQAAQLNVIKQVINNNGGIKTAADFTLTVTGGSPSPASFAGNASGTLVTLNAGAYSVDEAAVAGYIKSLGANCSGTIAIGESKTCTITNDDQPGQLTVVKHVINNNGGTRTAAQFTLTATGNSPSPASFPGSENGTVITVDPGNYGVEEAADPGYAKTVGVGCSGTIAAGEAKTCTITNDDKAATLTVTKHVINNNGGTKTASDFTMTVTGGAPSLASFAGSENGTVVSLNAGNYSVDELAATGYMKTVGASCSGTIALAESKICTITNDDQAAPSGGFAFMTGGGQVTSPNGTAITFGGNARGTPGASDANGHFNVLNHQTREHYEGDVTAVLSVDAANQEMTFCFTTKSGGLFTVGWRDSGKPGKSTRESSALNDRITLATGCAYPTSTILWGINNKDTGQGNIQWHPR